MDFDEVFACPFTTPTTCYSCGTNNPLRSSEVKQSLAQEIEFATETHILGVRIPEPTMGAIDSIDVQTASRSLPRDSAQLACVGYANWEEKKERIIETTTVSQQTNTELSNGSDVASVHRVQAIALIDPDLIEGHLLPDHESSSSALNLHRPVQDAIEKDDTVSVTTFNADMRSLHSKQNHRRHHRNVSSTSASSMISGTGGSTNNLLLSSGSGGSYHRKSQSELSRGSHTTISDTQPPIGDVDKSKNNKPSSMPKSKGRLVLKQNRYTARSSSHPGATSKDNNSTEHGITLNRKQQQDSSSSFALLDFRPLSPCVSRWGNKGYPNSNTTQVNNVDSDGFLGVWVGSADDATLRFYTPSSNDPRSLVSVPLPDDYFSVESPVMALDFCSVRWQDREKAPIMSHTLAVACQDGTIQLITWQDRIVGGSGDDGNTSGDKNKPFSMFGEISVQKVIVDGPLVCLKLDYNPFTSLRVIVGSLSGYVCQLIYNTRDRGGNSKSFWKGPFMVVKDLFNSSVNTQESVLSVDASDNYVVIGTQLGRCLLYATHDSENYFLVWQAVVPYSVHDVSIMIRNNIDQEGGNRSMIFDLAVTTRRSFHLFRATGRGIKWLQKPRNEHFSPDLARSRLMTILQEIRNENQKTDMAARRFVLETMEGILDKVEETTIDPQGNISAAPDTPHGLTDPIQAQNEESSTPRPVSVSNIRDEKVPVDTPHWEYSSSDEEMSIEPKRDSTDNQELQQSLSEAEDDAVTNED